MKKRINYAELADDRVRGLYQKFDVHRVWDPNNKHDNCEFFVLDLNHDKFAYPTLMTYIQACQSEYPQLAKDLLASLYMTRKLK